MTPILRCYHTPDDFDTVSDFLITHYQPNNRDGNWFQPIWEYMHSHPYLDETSLNKIGIWEDDGQIVGVVHYESVLGEVFFELHPDYAALKPAMLDYAERYLFGLSDDGKRHVKAFVNDFDHEFQALVRSCGYEKEPAHNRPMSAWAIPDPFPAITLPEGFRLKSLADENDLMKIHRVLWRGFNHPGEPPTEGIRHGLEGRQKMQSGPHFRKDLTIVVETPSGNYGSFCGMWYEPTNKIAYVEPVATDPDYRRMGLGKAAVLEGIRRCAVEGATIAYVGSDQLFYQALGFKVISASECWVKYWAG